MGAKTMTDMKCPDCGLLVVNVASMRIHREKCCLKSTMKRYQRHVFVTMSIDQLMTARSSEIFVVRDKAALNELKNTLDDEFKSGFKSELLALEETLHDVQPARVLVVRAAITCFLQQLRDVVKHDSI
jgi:hypothetical protein